MQCNANMNTATQRCMLEHLNRQLLCCENLQTRNNKNNTDNNNIAAGAKVAIHALC
jgi:hypothetical protein